LERDNPCDPDGINYNLDYCYDESNFDEKSNSSIQGSSSSVRGSSSSVGTIIPIKTLLVGGTGSIGSFVDIDNNATYTVNQYISNASKIDIVYGVAFINREDKIWSAFDFGFEYDESLTQNFTMIAPLSAFADAATVNTTFSALTVNGVKESDMSIYRNIFLRDDFIDKFFEASEIGYIDPNKNKVFIVFSTDGNLYLVAVKEKNSTIDITLAYIAL
jgi:hypothetical protein